MFSGKGACTLMIETMTHLNSIQFPLLRFMSEGCNVITDLCRLSGYFSYCLPIFLFIPYATKITAFEILGRLDYSGRVHMSQRLGESITATATIPAKNFDTPNVFSL